MKHFIAIDLGATSGRVILASIGEQSLEMEIIHRFENRLTEVNGKYYWDIYALYDDIVYGLTAVGKRGIEVESIGVDTWGVDMVLVAEDGTLCSQPRSYRDPYTIGIPNEFFKKISRREVYERTGIQIMNFNSLFQLYALQREDSALLRNVKHILFMPDALSYMLTGERVCEYTILSTSQFMNPRTHNIDAELLAAAGVDGSLFPRIVMPGEIVGRLSDKVARQTALGTVPVVAVAGHDTGSAVAAVPSIDAGFAYLSSGTWSLMGIETSEPIITDESFAQNFTNEGGVDGTTRFLKNITGMWLLEQCRKAWKQQGKTYTYDDIMQMTLAASPSQSVIDPDAAEFSSPTDMPEAIKRYCRTNGLQIPSSEGEIMRLIFDSLATKYAQVLDKLRSMAPFEINTLHIIGGGAQNDLLNQMTADACHIRVVAGPSEATALGNIMVQARTAGMVTSLQDSRRFLSHNIETKEYKPKTI